MKTPKPLPKYPTINITQEFIDAHKSDVRHEMDYLIMAHLEEKYPSPLPRNGDFRWGASGYTVYGELDDGKGAIFRISPAPPTTVQPFKGRLYREKKSAP